MGVLKNMFSLSLKVLVFILVSSYYPFYELKRRRWSWLGADPIPAAERIFYEISNLHKAHIIAVYALRMVIANTVLKLGLFFHPISDENSRTSILDIWKFITDQYNTCKEGFGDSKIIPMMSCGTLYNKKKVTFEEINQTDLNLKESTARKTRQTARKTSQKTRKLSKSQKPPKPILKRKANNQL